MEELSKPVVNNQYIDHYGRIFNIPEIAYINQNKNYHFGELIHSSHDDSDKSFLTNESGFNIYRDYNDINIGYKIYKGLPLFLDEFKFNEGSMDARLIEELMERQKDIKLTDFPTGVITINGYVIGQRIRLYNDYKSLGQFAKSVRDIENKGQLMAKAYLDILKALKEMIEHEIFYSDIHQGNFVVGYKNETVEAKVIDFESFLMSFGEIRKGQIGGLQNRLPFLLNNMNRVAKINYNFDNISSDKPIDDMIEKVLKM